MTAPRICESNKAVRTLIRPRTKNMFRCFVISVSCSKCFVTLTEHCIGDRLQKNVVPGNPPPTSPRDVCIILPLPLLLADNGNYFSNHMSFIFVCRKKKKKVPMGAFLSVSTNCRVSNEDIICHRRCTSPMLHHFPKDGFVVKDKTNKAKWGEKTQHDVLVRIFCKVDCSPVRLRRRSE